MLSCCYLVRAKERVYKYRPICMNDGKDRMMLRVAGLSTGREKRDGEVVTRVRLFWMWSNVDD